MCKGVFKVLFSGVNPIPVFCIQVHMYQASADLYLVDQLLSTYAVLCKHFDFSFSLISMDQIPQNLYLIYSI